MHSLREEVLLLGASSLLFISETHQPYILQGGLGVVTSPQLPQHQSCPQYSHQPGCNPYPLHKQVWVQGYSLSSEYTKTHYTKQAYEIMC